MYRKIIGILVLCALTLVLAAGCAGKPDASAASGSPEAPPPGAMETTPAGEDAGDTRYFDDPDSGLRFLLPDVWHKAMYETANITVSSFTHGYSFDYLSDSGKAALEQLFAGGMPENEADYTPEQKKLLETFQKGVVPLCAIAVEKDGERDDELRSMFPKETPLGEKDGTTYTLLTNPDTDDSALGEADQAACKALLAATAEFGKDMTLSGKREVNLDGAVAFNSKTVDGKDIDSSVFKDNKLTMVNIWATWCGPCVGELPELQALSEQLPAGVKLLGICTDGAEENAAAKEILQTAGVKYDNVVANEEMNKGFLSNVQAYPTTIFVDSAGNIVGEPFSGAPSGDVAGTYLAEIQSRLDMLEK